MKNKAVRFLAVRFLAAGAATLALLPLAGCGSGGGSSSVSNVLPTPSPTPSPIDGPETTRGAYQNLQYTFTVLRHNYVVGEVVPMTFTIQNTGTTDAIIKNTVGTFVEAVIQNPNGQYLYDIEAIDVTDKTDTTAASAVTVATEGTSVRPVYSLRVAAGQTRTFSLQWKQSVRLLTTDPGPSQAEPGSYVLTAKISAQNLSETVALRDGLPAPPITITIGKADTSEPVVTSNPGDTSRP